MTTILALDLGVVMGFATGKPGTPGRPGSGSLRLKRPDQSGAVAFATLINWIDAELRANRPALVVKEQMLPLQAYRDLGNAAHTVTVTAGLHAIVEGFCVTHRVRCESVADSTVRKHFIGRANMGSRERTKRAVIDRCHLLGLLTHDVRDPDRADALALWDYAAASYGRRESALHLFGEHRKPNAPLNPTDPF